jgi:hypothetical protein
VTSMFPSINDYQQLLQHPEINLKDSRLKSCQVESDPMGLPRVRSGGFALTYRLENSGNRFAVRCFKQDDPERTDRYRAICTYLAAHQCDIFVPVEYLPGGLLWRGNTYPITVMDWVEGDSLSNFLYRNIRHSKELARLPQEFLRLVTQLEKLGVAHGDFSQLNILVQGRRLILIDYDAMYVPELKGKLNTELGNKHFQHPARSYKDFGPELDRFSGLVLFLTLQALVSMPALYEQYATGGEGLIFHQDDFFRPYDSPLLKKLESLLELKKLIEPFRQICISDIKTVPRLEDFLSGSLVLPVIPARSQPRPVYRHTYPLFDAQDKIKLFSNVGDYITVIGRVEGIHDDMTRNGSPYVFLNLGNWRSQCFTIVLWSEALDLMQQAGKNPLAYQGKWVSVNGLLSIYSSTWGNRPQIYLESPTDIEILTEKEARYRLANAQNVIELEEEFTTESKQVDAPFILPSVSSTKIDIVPATPSSALSPKPATPVVSSPAPRTVSPVMAQSPLITTGLNKLYGPGGPTPVYISNSMDANSTTVKTVTVSVQLNSAAVAQPPAAPVPISQTILSATPAPGTIVAPAQGQKAKNPTSKKVPIRPKLQAYPKKLLEKSRDSILRFNRYQILILVFLILIVGFFIFVDVTLALTFLIGRFGPRIP